MPEPKATDQVLGEIMTELSELTQHVTDAANRVSETLHRVVDLESRIKQNETDIEVLVGKTHGLSPRPSPRNCIHCGMVLRGVQNRCGTCGKGQ
jgi:hypothetical protein